MSTYVGILEWAVAPYFYRFNGARCGEIAQVRMKDVVTIDGVLCLNIPFGKTAMRSTKIPFDILRIISVHGTSPTPQARSGYPCRGGAGRKTEARSPLAQLRDHGNVAAWNPRRGTRKLVDHMPRDVHAGYNHLDMKRLVETVIAIP